MGATNSGDFCKEFSKKIGILPLKSKEKHREKPLMD